MMEKETESTFATLQTLKYAEDLARLYQLEKAREEDLRSGARMQARFLTPSNEVEAIFDAIGYRVTLYNKAPSPVSGDFFCPKPIGDDEAGFLLADACGHGLSAALISMRISSFIQTANSRVLSPGEFLAQVGEDICGLMPRGYMVAGLYARFNKSGCSIAGAGLPYPLLIREGNVTEIAVPGPPLGPFCPPEYNEAAVEMRSGDKLLLHTDGLTESVSREEEPFGEERLKEVITQNATKGADSLRNAVMAEFCGHVVGADPDDDITLVIFEKQGDP